MALSNQTFFGIRALPILEQAGWTVRVLDHTDYATVLAIANDFVSLRIGPELNAVGAGSVTFDLDSPFWSATLANGQPASTLLNFEHLWEAYEDGVLRFQWLGTNVDERLVEEAESRVVTVSGPGTAHVLTWSCILPPYFPPASEALRASSWFWQFPVTYPSMKIWLRLLAVSKKRGTVPWVTPLFTETHDSGGAVWQVVQTQATIGDPGSGIRPDMGTNMLDLLNVHTGQDLNKQFAMRAEWFMWPGFKLDVRKVIGTHREGQVIFFEGGLQQKERTRVRDDIANYIVTVGVNGSSSFAVDSPSVHTWNQREQLQNRNMNITDPARRTAVGQVTLQQHKDEKSQWVIRIPYDQPGRRVFRDFGIGDWIGISSIAANGVSTVDPYRVMAAVVDVQNVTTTVELTLQSKLDAHQLDLQKQLTSIINAVGAGGDTTITTEFPALGDLPGIVAYDPSKGLAVIPLPGTGGSSTGGGGLGGVKVFIQRDDPGDLAVEGDIWVML